jgi:CubicO group peptidase (beta-lactamase class C family)
MRRAIAPAVLVIATAIAQLAVWTRPHAPPMLDEDTLPRGVPAIGAAEVPGSIEELRQRVARVLEREGVPGVAIALVGREGPRWIGGVGVADRATRAPVTADTVFRVASITKSIVGLGVMRLVEQGRLELDRPLRELLPDAGIANAWEAEAPVTLAHVLEHTAGLDDMRFNEWFSDDDALAPAATLAINPGSRRIRWRPGTRLAYSNVGYTLAGRAIEVATGEPFDAWLRREVVQPLGMRDADFHRTDALAARLATGYGDRDRPVTFRAIAHRPAGALLASATHLAGLVQFWLRRGEGQAIVSPAGLDRIERSGTLPYPRTDLEYGLGNYGDVSHPVRARGHDGGWPGFLSSMRYVPELGLGYVVLFNASHSYRAFVEIRALVFAYLVRGRVAPPPPALAIAATDRPAASFYGFASPRHELFGFLERTMFGWRAVEVPGAVRLDPLLGDSFHLVPAKDGGYRLPWESGSSFRFAQDRDGEPVMIGHLSYAEAGSRWLARLRITACAAAMLLLQLAPLWAAGVLAVAALRRRRRPVALGLALWPAVAGLSVLALPQLLAAAAMRDVLGVVHPLTVALCATTLVFAIASCGGLAAAIRWSVRRDRPSRLHRLVPTLCALAAFGMMLWLAANHIIGLRTWAW